jgi:putative membrane protein
MKHVLLVAVAAASLTACSSMGMGRGDDMAGMAPHTMPDGSTMGGPMSGPMMPTQAMGYLRAAGESDLFEITSSQTALQRTQNPEIRAFAPMLIDHHTGTTNATLAAAKAGRIPPPPVVLGPDKRAMIEQLNSQTGRAFDQLFIRQQVPAHEQALALHAGYARSGDVPTLRASAAAAVPIVTRHLAEARAMQARMGGMSGM